jgi:hypothetical protein
MFLSSLKETWNNRVIAFTDLKGEENELVLSDLYYDIGNIGDLIVFRDDKPRYGLYLTYTFRWTKPQKYVPPFRDGEVGRGFEKVKIRYQNNQFNFDRR